MRRGQQRCDPPRRGLFLRPRHFTRSRFCTALLVNHARGRPQANWNRQHINVQRNKGTYLRNFSRALFQARRAAHRSQATKDRGQAYVTLQQTIPRAYRGRQLKLTTAYFCQLPKVPFRSRHHLVNQHEETSKGRTRRNGNFENGTSQARGSKRKGPCKYKLPTPFPSKV